jgi:hypothetical protein
MTLLGNRPSKEGRLLEKRWELSHRRKLGSRSLMKSDLSGFTGVLKLGHKEKKNQGASWVWGLSKMCG